jgi:hypothetical protein
MVLEWRETSLVADQTICNAQCAVLSLESGRQFSPSTLLGISLLDATPYGPGQTFADCGCDGLPGNDHADCNGNGEVDVTVLVTSLFDASPGECVVLDQATPSEYWKGTLSISTAHH